MIDPADITVGWIGSLSLVVIAAGTLAYCLGMFTPLRHAFTRRPLGLNHRQPLPHSVRSVEEFRCWHQWAGTLCRSMKSTLCKQVDKTLDQQAISVHTIPTEQLGFAHFDVLWDHQRRKHSAPVSLLGACIRFAVAKLMVGSVDEYWSKGECVAWAATVVKGDTLRAMWFYQKSHVRRWWLWYHSARTAIQRAIIMEEVQWVDLGPSVKSNVSMTKERIGFVSTKEWRSVGWCGYEGPYRPAPSWAELAAKGRPCGGCGQA